VNDVAVNLNRYNVIGFEANFSTGLVEYLVNGTNIGSSQMGIARFPAVMAFSSLLRIKSGTSGNLTVFSRN
jgi:hypothetical protein